MKLTPAFVAAAVACAIPFALAVRDDLTRPSKAARLSSEDPGDRWTGGLTVPRPDPNAYPDPDPTDLGPPPLTSRSIGPNELAELVGPDPATLGPLFDGLELGTPVDSFMPEPVRQRIERYKLVHDLAVDFDVDNVTVDAFTLRVTGDETRLRDRMITMWGTPRRLAEDMLAWLGPDGHRAVYHAVPDGFDLVFEPALTPEALIAPDDPDKLGFEPFSLVGARLDKLVDMLGERLQLDLDGIYHWHLPGLGLGGGRTIITLALSPGGDKINGFTVAANSADSERLRDVLIQKWGPPTVDPGGDTVRWKRPGRTVELIADRTSFTITVAK